MAQGLARDQNLARRYFDHAVELEPLVAGIRAGYAGLGDP